MFGDMTKRIGTLITKFIGIGARSDTKRIHHQNNCPRHESGYPFDHNRRDIRRFLIDDDGLRDDVLNIFCGNFAGCMDPTDRLSHFQAVT